MRLAICLLPHGLLQDGDPIDGRDPSGKSSASAAANVLDVGSYVVQGGSYGAAGIEVVGSEGLALVGPAEETVVAGTEAAASMRALANSLRAASAAEAIINQAKANPGKNDAHVSQERKANAVHAAAEAKSRYQKLNSKPNKTLEDKKDRDQAEIATST